MAAGCHQFRYTEDLQNLVQIIQKMRDPRLHTLRL